MELIANHDKINIIAKRHNVRVLHDAAHSLDQLSKKEKSDHFQILQCLVLIQ